MMPQVYRDAGVWFQPGTEASAAAPEPPVEPLFVERRTIRLPALRVPEASRKRIVCPEVEKVIREIFKPGSGKCTVVVPYVDRHSPYLPVLTECPDESSVLFMIRNGNTWYPTAGGWYPHAELVRRLKPRFLKYASVILRQ